MTITCPQWASLCTSQKCLCEVTGAFEVNTGAGSELCACTGLDVCRWPNRRYLHPIALLIRLANICLISCATCAPPGRSA
jgi:hypothetical protein